MKRSSSSNSSTTSRENGNSNLDSLQPRTVSIQKNPSDQSCEIIVERVELKRSIAFGGAVALLLANIGGTSVFIVPTTLLRYAGSPALSLFMWLIGGIVQAILSICVAEVAVMYNKAGGPYLYIYKTFGDLPAFVFMWGFIAFIAAPVWALGSYTCSLYLLSIIYGDCSFSDSLLKLVAAWIMSK